MVWFYAYPTESQLAGLYSETGKFVARVGGNPGHFVTVENVTFTTVKFWDPSGGIYKTMPIKEFTNNVSGLIFKGK
jgi:hypothetical protein